MSPHLVEYEVEDTPVLPIDFQRSSKGEEYFLFRPDIYELQCKQGVDFVVASGTKALDGRDQNMWGYIASDHIDVLNGCLDLMAMRGGVLDGRRAGAIVSDLESARERFGIRRSKAIRTVMPSSVTTPSTALY